MLNRYIMIMSLWAFSRVLNLTPELTLININPSYCNRVFLVLVPFLPIVDPFSTAYISSHKFECIKPSSLDYDVLLNKYKKA